MSGQTDVYDASLSPGGCKELKRTVVQIADGGIEEILKIWYELYGPTGTSGDRAAKLVDDVRTFWESQIESQNERKENLSKSIEQAGKEALRLERILGLRPEVKNMTCEKDVPLVALEEQIWKILNSYQEVCDKRLEECSELQKKEEELCSALNIKPQIRNEILAAREGLNSTRKESGYIPTSDNMSVFKERIYELEKQKEQLEYEFETRKEKLRLLLEQCEITPNKTVERYIFLGKEDFPVTNINLKLLISTADHYENIQKEMVAEVDYLRNQVASLGKKMFLDLQLFLKENSGYTKTTIENLKEKLKQLKEERKEKLKDLIISHREILEEMWKKCCFSEEEKAQFKPYHATHWSEEVLNFHELEIEKLQNFYEQNNKVFQLADKYDNLWERLLQLEELTSNKDRLFNNRGGCLLKEEKERKLIQKKVPTVRAELIGLLIKYREDTGKDFTQFGMPLQQKIEQRDELREMSKQHDKLLRKVINEENLFFESRLGARPLAGNKRRVLTPQHPNNHPKLIKTTAHSTPRLSRSASCLSGSVTSASTWTRVVRENEQKGDAWLKPKPRPTKIGRRIKCDTPRPPVKTPVTSTPQCSPSYESFQEHITKSGLKRSHEERTNPAARRVLRPRDENKPGFLSEKKFHRCITPMAKTTLKSATVSKIPRPATPVDPKPVGSRRKLPIIF